jgi:hypothetical protein
MSGENQGSTQSPFAADESDEEFGDITPAAPSVPSWEDPLEELFFEAQKSTKPRPGRRKPPNSSAQLAEALERQRRIYTNPENWIRTRGVALVDLETGTLLGNFSEYCHISDQPGSRCRKFIREHQPISVEGTELINGYLGASLEAKIRNVVWEKEHLVSVAVQLDELMVEAPAVELKIFTRFGGICRADLVRETQFACPSGNVILRFAAGTNVWEACSTDTKISIRKEVLP